MANRLKEWTRQHRPLILVASVLLAIGVLAVAVAAVFWWNARSDQPEETASPVLVDTPIADAGGTEVSVAFRGDDGADESGDDRLVIRLSEGQPVNHVLGDLLVRPAVNCAARDVHYSGGGSRCGNG